MRAAVIEELGGRPVVRDLPEPRAATGEVLVSISTAALNPADIVYAAGIRLKPTLPYVPGLEGVGRLDDGSRVYLPMAPAPHGTFAERSVARAGTPVPVPHDVSDAQALGVGVAGTTGHLALTWKGQFQSGAAGLVRGAPGAVGPVAVPAAGGGGAAGVGAAGRDRPTLERLLSLGADEIVVLENDYPDALAQAAHGGFDLVVDALFGEPMMAAIRATRMGGRIVNLGMRAGRTMQLDGIALKGKDLLSCNIGDATDADVAASFTVLLTLVAEGSIHTESETVPLADVASVWARQDSSPHAKLLLAI
ncbi:zinc-binding dehydrogenase [Nocardioides sp.]|uniref:zinc-binding dehydrogenase n=1 Tax=Nocardioides sp. TaxID=35761 RepID=UPI00261161A2|nr:zinc-binding dehydrogenase [Nocardioides sp.]